MHSSSWCCSGWCCSKCVAWRQGAGAARAQLRLLWPRATHGPRGRRRAAPCRSRRPPMGRRRCRPGRSWPRRSIRCRPRCPAVAGEPAPSAGSCSPSAAAPTPASTCGQQRGEAS
jgi:hypothetical protein